MRLIFTLLFLIIIQITLQAQFFFRFDDLEEVPCPHDSSFLLKKIVDWEVYQTEDDQWNGTPISKCIPVEANANGLATIPIAFINLDKPVFVRYTGERDAQFNLESNWIYQGGASISISGDSELKTGFDCPGNWCSGLMVGVEVPNEDRTGKKLRVYQNDNTVPQPDDFQICFPTEYFQENDCQEIVMKFTVIPNGSANTDFITLSRFSFEPAWDQPSLFYELPVPESFRNDSIYVVNYIQDLIGGDWGQTPMMGYGDPTTYPSINNIFYVEAYPEVNRPEPQLIRIETDFWSYFHIQPFTALRGGLVEGSDSIRHAVEVVNEDVDFCLGPLIELTIDGENSKYIHVSGDIEFSNKNSCMQFRNGAILQVAEDAEFKFGDEGNGLLVFRGGKLELQKNATFILDGRMDFAEKAKHQNISVNLERGKKLIFTKKAQLLNRASQKDLKLDIYMNGGVLDMENLDADSRRLINLIYPEPKPAFAENIEVFPNPVSDYLNICFLGKADEKLTIELLDLTGRVFYKKEEIAGEGWNEFSISDLNFARGVYFLKMSSGEKQVTERIFVK